MSCSHIQNELDSCISCVDAQMLRSCYIRYWVSLLRWTYMMNITNQYTDTKLSLSGRGRGTLSSPGWGEGYLILSWPGDTTYSHPPQKGHVISGSIMGWRWGTPRPTLV